MAIDCLGTVESYIFTWYISLMKLSTFLPKFSSRAAVMAPTSFGNSVTSADNFSILGTRSWTVLGTELYEKYSNVKTLTPRI